jgi:hypothetical protein
MKGREALMTCVNVASETLKLDVIYGDTDRCTHPYLLTLCTISLRCFCSIMINTNSDDLAHVKEMGNSVKKEVSNVNSRLIHALPFAIR